MFWILSGSVPVWCSYSAALGSKAKGLLQPKAECLRRGLWKPFMYSKSSTSRRVCQLCRQTDLAFGEVQPGGGLPILMAMFSARKAGSCFTRLLMAQPTTRRENRSIITVR